MSTLKNHVCESKNTYPHLNYLSNKKHNGIWMMNNSPIE